MSRCRKETWLALANATALRWQFTSCRFVTLRVWICNNKPTVLVCFSPTTAAKRTRDCLALYDSRHGSSSVNSKGYRNIDKPIIIILIRLVLRTVAAIISRSNNTTWDWEKNKWLYANLISNPLIVTIHIGKTLLTCLVLKKNNHKMQSFIKSSACIQLILPPITVK